MDTAAEGSSKAVDWGSNVSNWGFVTADSVIGSSNLVPLTSWSPLSDGAEIGAASEGSESTAAELHSDSLDTAAEEEIKVVDWGSNVSCWGFRTAALVTRESDLVTCLTPCLDTRLTGPFLLEDEDLLMAAVDRGANSNCSFSNFDTSSSANTPFLKFFLC